MQRIPTELFYRIAYALMFSVSAAILAQGVVGLLRGWGIFARMKRIIAIVLAAARRPAHAFDLQGHRGARGLAPENTLPASRSRLSIGVTTLELDLAMTRDDVLVVSHDRQLNPDHTRGAGRAIPRREGPAIRSLTLGRSAALRCRPPQARQRLCDELSRAAAADGARIPALTELFDLVTRIGAEHVRFNIETKITPTSGAETPDPETFAAAVAKAVRDGRADGARQRAVVRLAHAWWR